MRACSNVCTIESERRCLESQIPTSNYRSSSPRVLVSVACVVRSCLPPRGLAGGAKIPPSAWVLHERNDLLLQERRHPDAAYRPERPTTHSYGYMADF
jgi:hypothetical protein